MTTRKDALVNWMRACRYEHDEEVLAMRPDLPLVVGEAPNRGGYGSTDRPEGWPCEIFATGRLATVGDIARFERVNLLDYWPGAAGAGSAFPMGEARVSARRLLGATEGDRELILVGTRVAQAFGLRRDHYEYLTWFARQGGFGRLVAVCPHPSGLNRWWNNDENVRRAREFFMTVLDETRSERDG